MPLLWRYLLIRFLKIFLLVTLSFLLIILIFRLTDIARFACVDGDIKKTCFFALLQMPYIAPFAISFGALISSYLLSQHLSLTHELTSLRASGSSIAVILTPVVCLSFFLGCANFLIFSELTPLCRMKTDALLYKSVVDNPLHLLKKKKFLNVKNSFVDVDISEDASIGRNLLIAFLESSKQTLSLVFVKSLVCDGPLLKGNQGSMVSSLYSDVFDPGTILENYDYFEMPSCQMTNLLKKEKKARSEDQLTSKELIIRSKKSSKKDLQKCLLELKKRLFFFFLPLTFSSLGLLWGLQHGRSVSRRGNPWFAFLLFVVFAGYFVGKSLTYRPWLSSFAFFCVHPLTLCLAGRKLYMIEHGLETC